MRRRSIFALVVVSTSLVSVLIGGTAATAKQHSIRAAGERHGTLTFKLRGLEGADVKAAKVVGPRRKTLPVSARRVERAARRGVLRVKLPRSWRRSGSRTHAPARAAHHGRGSHRLVVVTDTTPPETTVTSGPSGTISSGSTSFGFASNESNSVFGCRIDAGTWGGCTSPKAYSGLADGNHTFEVRAKDAAGNVDPTPAVRSFTVQTSTSTPPPTTGVDPSGQAAPRGDLPGWRQIFVDDFSQNVPLGSFPAAVSDTWGAYPYPWRDTSRNGYYHPQKVVSIGGGLMDMWIHSEVVDGSMKHLVAAPQPRIHGPGTPAAQGQLYGRYAVRFRSDALRGYKTAWLLWPDSEVWPRDGEIDFPEGDLDSTICAFMHRQNATSGGDQDGACTSARYPTWHTAVVEWGPLVTKFILDGQVILSPTSRIPNTPMHWVLQTETSLSGIVPDNSTAGHVQVDWVAVYARA